MISTSKRKLKRRWTMVKKAMGKVSLIGKTKQILVQAKSSRIKWTMMIMLMRITNNRWPKGVKVTSWSLK